MLSKDNGWALSRSKQIRKFLKFNKSPNKPPNLIFFQYRPLLREYSYLFFVISYLKTIIPWAMVFLSLPGILPSSTYNVYKRGCGAVNVSLNQQHSPKSVS